MLNLKSTIAISLLALSCTGIAHATDPSPAPSASTSSTIPTTNTTSTQTVVNQQNTIYQAIAANPTPSPSPSASASSSPAPTTTTTTTTTTSSPKPTTSPSASPSASPTPVISYAERIVPETERIPYSYTDPACVSSPFSAEGIDVSGLFGTITITTERTKTFRDTISTLNGIQTTTNIELVSNVVNRITTTCSLGKNISTDQGQGLTQEHLTSVTGTKVELGDGTIQSLNYVVTKTDRADKNYTENFLDGISLTVGHSSKANTYTFSLNSNHELERLQTRYSDVDETITVNRFSEVGTKTKRGHLTEIYPILGTSGYPTTTGDYVETDNTKTYMPSFADGQVSGQYEDGVDGRLLASVVHREETTTWTGKSVYTSRSIVNERTEYGYGVSNVQDVDQYISGYTYSSDVYARDLIYSPRSTHTSYRGSGPPFPINLISSTDHLMEDFGFPSLYGV
jgi:hypothetical protein